MRGVLRRCALALALLAGLTAPAARARTGRHFVWSRQAQQDPAGYYFQPAGLGEDYPPATRTQARLDQDFALVRRAGVRLLRVGIPWDDVEPAPGRYDWVFWDRLVATAARAHVTLIPYVCYTPRWAAGGEQFWTQPPVDPALFGRFMRAIAGRYRGRVRSWELWNEPDNHDFWCGSAGEYAALLRAGAAGVRRGDPRAAVVLGGLANGASPFLRALQTGLRLRDVVDAVNVHGYFETWTSYLLEDYPAYIARVARAVPGPDLWMAEFGYSSLRPTASGPAAGVPVHYAYEHTAAYQAAALFKSHVLALATGRLSLTVWYRIHDLPPSTGVIGNAHNRFLGVVDVRGRPKPAFFALRLYDRLFGRPTRCLDASVRVRRRPGSRSVVHVFAVKGGPTVVVGWLRSSLPGEVRDRSGAARDERAEEVSLALPSRRRACLAVYDVTGRRVPSGATLWRGRLAHVRLTGDRVFIARVTGPGR